MKKNIILTIILIFSFFFSIQTAFVENCNQTSDPLCLEKISDDLKPIKKDTDLPNTIMEMIKYLSWFLWFIAILYWLYWAWNIFSALSDDNKVKNWKTIIIRACIWLVIIFLAYPITNFVINDLLFSKEKINNTNSNQIP